MKKSGKLAKGIASVMALVMAFSVVFSSSLTTQAATESKEIFSGGTNESYESNDASWLMNADDSDVIKIVYTCTEKANAGWGVLGWGATVDDVWKDGPGLSASETDATEKVTAKVTAGDLKKTLGIKDGSNVSYIKLGAWNGGKIESLSISGAGAASVDSSSSSDTAEEVVIQAPPELTGDYLYLVDSTETITIWPDLYLQYWVPGQTIHLKIEMESNGSFGGCLGTCVNKWAWQMEQFSSDTGSTITVDWFLTPIMNNIQLQFWWMSGSQIGIKSIEVVKAIDYTIYPEIEEEDKEEEPGTPGKDPYAGDPNASYSGYMDVADSSWWTQTSISFEGLLGGVDPSTVSSIVFKGEVPFQIGYNGTAGSWTQHDNVTNYTATDIDLNPEVFYAAIGFSKGDGVPYRFTWDVYTNGAVAEDGTDETPEVPEDETPEVPEDETPEVPEDETPEVPEDETPEVPEDETPEVPEDETPEVPEDETPEVPEDETPEVPEDETPEVPEDETPEVPEDETSDVTTIFTGGGDEYTYTTYDASWLKNANDSDVITIVYDATRTDVSYWDVVLWVASLDGSWDWIQGPKYTADGTDSTKEVTATITVGELKSAFGITDSTEILFLGMTSWNSGRVKSITLTPAN